MGVWMKYATWEESIKEFERARSVFERALVVDHRNIALWLRYAEMEMRNKNVNRARNIWDRAVAILPRVDAFWYKYSYMEEMLGNVAGARLVFERWMEWQPEEPAWQAYIKMELRYSEVGRARDIYERMIVVHPDIKHWIRFAKFEEQHNQPTKARAIYERAIGFFEEFQPDERLFISFAAFEESAREFERARVIFKYALDLLPKDKAQELFKAYTQFEKKHGDRAGIEDVVVGKRRLQYEEEVAANPKNYDAWFDYIRLEESTGDFAKTRDIYERSISNVPPAEEKRLWRRYIYLWIFYALFEELQAKDPERTRQVFKACIQLIPHKIFTFGKIWLLYAQFEIREKNLKAARLALGNALGMCPKDNIFKGYIELELQLREFDRCRKLYEKYLEFNPANCATWTKFAELETVLGDVERARALYELAIGQPLLDMPEVLWKAYIDFESELEEWDRTRDLYERLLKRTQHVKVWISFAQFEANIEGADGRVERARAIFERADKLLSQAQLKEERVMLLESWREFEANHGSSADLSAVQKKLPQKVKKRRQIQGQDGTEAGWEEYFDYIFPDEQSAAPGLKLLQMAHLWKMKQHNDDDDGGDDGDDPDTGDNGGNDGGDSASDDDAGQGEGRKSAPHQGDAAADGSSTTSSDSSSSSGSDDESEDAQIAPSAAAADHGSGSGAAADE
eukprot:Opistho-2@51725